MFDTGWNFNAKNFFKNIYIFSVRNNHRRIDRGGIGGGGDTWPHKFFTVAQKSMRHSGKTSKVKFGKIMICPEKFEIIELLYVCENYGILVGNFLVCPENVFVPSPPPLPCSPTILGRNIRSGKLILCPPPNKIRPVRPWK